MTKITFNKLVRDKIPEIIKTSGKIAHVRILDETEYKHALRNKLLEEVNEFIKDDTVEELADITEVLLAILKQRNLSLDEFEKKRIEKKEEIGAFEKKLWLIETE
ncbi:MAG: nucleoside triphosphate pyrophosphohydrolase [Planctomycetaceae bacterium]|jgi:predicted house-cleaning noncanonical NTP pyrophosphatase (MazG superfamily)|nr:nucleoside triphosphate pyrophosphohydrolase [Planctomycetaceae bacterium]